MNPHAYRSASVVHVHEHHRHVHFSGVSFAVLTAGVLLFLVGLISIARQSIACGVCQGIGEVR